MADPSRDQDFSSAYVAAATQLSSTFNSSSGTQTTISTNGAVGIVIAVDAVSLPTATELRITPVYWDGTTERVPRSDGTNPDYLAVTTTGMLPPYPVNSEYIRIEPWLDATDAAATCTITVNVIYE
jgi:hypothetical protein